MKRIATLVIIASLIAVTAQAGAPKPLAQDTAVRVEGSGIEPGWFEGKIFVTSEGCTMVKLARETKDGYTMLALIAIQRLQKKEGAGWRDLALKDLTAHEPKHCLEPGAD
jgi:hypothetical protein